MARNMNLDPWAKPRYQLWTVTSEEPKNTPLVEYGKGNDKRFTIRVVHCGYFTDYPEEHSSLSMTPILDDDALTNFKSIFRAHQFREIEHLYVEHKPVYVPTNFPHFMMNSPAKRVEKLIHLFVTEHPMSTVDDGIAYINHMLNITIPRGKMEDAMDMAKENVIAWKDLV
ncbi:unnamed protein product [Lactuca virosa]|uniref:Uncharacterized protein n=1 Tax=Lactuca virosa TaxID=75947 RepID=A0AAU9NMM2_9ASTR|nr:unnamed protein product [Lactuca virosa]